MLERHRRLWILGQFLAAAGTAAAPMGFIRLAQQFRSRPEGVQSAADTLSIVAAGALSAGSPPFVFYLLQLALGIRLMRYGIKALESEV